MTGKNHRSVSWLRIGWILIATVAIHHWLGYRVSGSRRVVIQTKSLQDHFDTTTR